MIYFLLNFLPPVDLNYGKSCVAALDISNGFDKVRLTTLFLSSHSFAFLLHSVHSCLAFYFPSMSKGTFLKVYSYYSFLLLTFLASLPILYSSYLDNLNLYFCHHFKSVPYFATVIASLLQFSYPLLKMDRVSRRG